jgi:hypothetical protein
LFENKYKGGNQMAKRYFFQGSNQKENSGDYSSLGRCLEDAMMISRSFGSKDQIRLYMVVGNQTIELAVFESGYPVCRSIA